MPDPTHPPPPTGPEGFLVIDKAAGITSHDVVQAVRRATGQRRVGHAGTLDPMATGVMVVAVGRVTRLLRFVQELPKEYLARGRFGVATDTLDAEGAVLSREPMELAEDDLTAVLPRFTGAIDQVPPMVSALKVGGERLYQIARRGEEVERPPRRVVVHLLEVVEVVQGPYPEVVVRVVCGKGTYVRSLVDDLARALGGRAHLSALRRLRVGSLGVEGALPVDGLEQWGDHLVAPVAALSDYPAVTVGGEVAVAVAHGVPFATGPLSEIEERPTLVLDDAGELMAIYRRQGQHARPEVVLA